MQFGLALSLFSMETMTVPVNRIGRIADAGKSLAEMAAAVPTKGGLWQLLLTGKTPLQSFSDGIGYFGDGIATFVDKVGDRVVNTSAVEAACVAGEKIAKMTSKLPEEGLFTSNRRNMKSFKTQIASFGEGIKAFIDILGTDSISIQSVDGAVTAGKKLAEMASKIPSVGLLAKDEKRDMKTFKTQIIDFGTGISEFATKVGTIDYSASVKAGEAGVKLATIASTIRNTDASRISTFAAQLPTLGSNLWYLAAYVGDINTDDLNSKIESVVNTINKIKELASSGIKGIADTFANSGSIIKQAFDNMLDAIVTPGTIALRGLQFHVYGTALLATFAGGIMDGGKNAKQAMEDVVDSILSVVDNNSLYRSFYDAGASASQGFLNGVNSKANAAKIAGSSLGTMALNALKSALRICSPSKEFAQAGEYSGGAYVDTLMSYGDQSYDAGYDMAKGALGGLRKAIFGIGNLLEDDINVQPVITPVLDLSQVTAGINNMNNMFGFAPSVGVLSRIDGISSSINNQNGGNDDVVSAINDLKNTVGNNSGDVYNINGITYDNGSELQAAIETIIRAARIERRV